tara:strand:- start:136 stop:789 length:654 start_codon:yes stop_codon:yes gene_type:complete
MKKILFALTLLSSVCFGQSKKEQIEILGNRVDSLKTILSETKVNLDEANKIIDSNKEKINDLAYQYKELEAEKENILQEKIVLQEKNNKLQSKLEAVERSLTVTNDTISELRMKIESLNKSNSMVIFAYCESEYDECNYNCKIEVIIGEVIAIGSYVRVFHEDDELGKIDQGYIVNHISGSIFIVPSLDDANNSNICGGCCDGTLIIDLENREVWGC